MALECSGSGSAFSLTQHACRYCAGRVLQSGDQYRCGGCGVVCMVTPAGICGCGIVARYSANQATFRCGPNPAKSAASPSEITILFDGKPALPMAA